MDPAENGSFNSCLVCPNGECKLAQQYLMPRDAGALWRCDGCGGDSSLAEVKVRTLDRHSIRTDVMETG